MWGSIAAVSVVAMFFFLCLGTFVPKVSTPSRSRTCSRVIKVDSRQLSVCGFLPCRAISSTL
jgi:hypothetical protein